MVIGSNYLPYQKKILKIATFVSNIEKILLSQLTLFRVPADAHWLKYMYFTVFHCALILFYLFYWLLHKSFIFITMHLQ